MSFLPEKYSSSTKLLIASNLATIILALVFNWSIMTLLVGYWSQSVIIGFFALLKMLVFPTKETGTSGIFFKALAGCFFTVHYGIFSLAHGMFLFFFSTGMLFATWGSPDLVSVALMGAIFFVNHAYSFYANYLRQPSDFTNYVSPFEFMIEPYSRIIPMHASIIAGGFLAAFLQTLSAFFASASFSAIFPSAEKLLLVFFLVVKAAADIRSHLIEHRFRAD